MTTHPKSTYAFLGRLHRVALAIQYGPVTVRRMAQIEEVNERSITRAISFLRDTLGWNIQGDHRGVWLVEPGQKLVERKK